MKFVDPMPSVCEHCGTRSNQAVADLLARKATCPQCQTDFNVDEMWNGIYDARAIFVLISITIAVEDQFPGIEFVDASIEHIRTLGELISTTEELLLHLPVEQRHSAAKTAVLEAVRVEVPQLIDPPLDVPWVDVVRPLVANAFVNPS
jgi:hypothetical protein